MNARSSQVTLITALLHLRTMWSIHPRTKGPLYFTLPKVKTLARLTHASPLHHLPALPAEVGTGGEIGEDPPALTPAVAPALLHLTPPAPGLALQKDKSDTTSIQRAVRVHHLHLALFLTPHRGSTRHLTQKQVLAGRGPDHVPARDLDPHPLLSAFVEDGEMLAEAESWESLGGSRK